MNADQRDAAVNIAAQVLSLLPDDPDAPAITVSISSVAELAAQLDACQEALEQAQARITEQNTTREGIADRTREEIATYLESVSDGNWISIADRMYAAALVRDPGSVPRSPNMEPLRGRPIHDDPQA